ncbi:hypothetical protein J8246_00490 [Corynebacterium tuberculostearicum]|uniref:hypothetical protein n=1 Tax=Corynebacterium TaxID=1716 RepID=UPI001EF1D1A0|nr:MULTISPECIES: hypothetical protein [Corynebacterium]MCG7465978.1 hypothetical protein [Corynebacterium sp. ACRPJ]WKE53075.1 hypothetical protein J8246_00490 [Corynebacterium tuberculostearicum]
MLNVENWTLKNPKAVENLLEARAKLEELVHAPAPSNDGFLSAETLESAIDQHTRFTLYNGQERRQAINLAQNTIERELKAEVNNNLNSYLKQVEAIFNPAAEAYAEAVEKLPTGKFTAEDVLNFSEPERVAYHSAREAAGVISWAADWLWELLDLPGQRLDGWGKWFLVCEPGNVAGLTCLFLEEEHTGEKGYDALLPPLLRALREGAYLRVATPAQASEAAQEQEHARQGMDEQAWLTLRRDLKL